MVRLYIEEKTAKKAKFMSWKTLNTAMYFSLITSTHLGWRDINLGSWISRLQGEHYTFNATGWLRTVSGIQSLLCIYLIAIWALTQFSLFFDW